MSRKTEGVYELVKIVMGSFSEPYNEDIIEEVCLAIEKDPDWLRQYNELGDELSHWVVNNWIGQYTKMLTGLKSLKQVEAKRSQLITSYTKLVP